MKYESLLSDNYRVLAQLIKTKETPVNIGYSCNKLVDVLHISKNKVSLIIKELEENGFVSSFEKKGFYIATNKGYQIFHTISSAINGIDKNQLTFIDLFAGIGGIRLGFEGVDTECVFSCEWDKFAQKTYKANFGDMPYGDITTINEADIPTHDILLAGFPCQPFSMIGKREGFDDEKGRGTLFFDILRILRYHQPKMILLENVPGILSIQGGQTFKTILNLLENTGYDIEWAVLDSMDFGLPQKRKRVIISGFRKDLEVKDFKIPLNNGKKETYACDIIEDNPKGYSISKHLQESYLFKKNDGFPQIIDKDSKVVCKTLCASYHKIQRITGTFVRGGETGIRLLSELECKRLMGYPEDFIFPVSRTQMYHQLGNSVCVPVITAVAEKMKNCYFKTLNINTDRFNQAICI